MSGFNQINSIENAMEVQLNVNCIYKFITFLVALFIFNKSILFINYIRAGTSTCSCNNNNLKHWYLLSFIKSSKCNFWEH